MNRQLLILTISFLTSLFVYGQKIKSPKDIQSAVTYLHTDCPDSLQQKIKVTPDDQLINLCYPWKSEYTTIYDWTEPGNKKSKIKKYVIHKGITYPEHQQTIILIAFKRNLLGQIVNEDEIIKPFKIIEDNWRMEDKVRLTTDSIRGVYIPKDLEDCFKQMDNILSDSTKMKVKKWTEHEFSGRIHWDWGKWMRNKWQLWSGSRLSKFFNDLGIYHPDDMSGIILASYHRYLTGRAINLDEQIKFYQEYWKKTKVNKKKIH